MFGWFRKNVRPNSPSPGNARNASGGEVFAGLRNQALATKRSQVGMPAPPDSSPIWGLLMETGYPKATATVFALADGTTSLYLSSGGGVIGGQGHVSVRIANAEFLAVANRLRQNLTPTTEYPFPKTGDTVFYALTDSGVLTGGGPENDLGHGRHPLSHLFHAGHGVLTQLRLITESKGQGG